MPVLTSFLVDVLVPAVDGRLYVWSTGAMAPLDVRAAAPLAFVLTLGSGCGGDEFVSNGNGEGAGLRGQLDVLPAPRTLRGALLDVDREATAGPELLVLHDRLALGLGEGYAESLEYRLQPYAFDDDCGVIIGDYVVQEVVSSLQSVDVEVTSAATLNISPTVVGEGEIVLRGVVGVDPMSCPELLGDPEQPFELRIETSVMTTPPAVAFEMESPCRDEATRYVQSGALLRGIRPVALDEAGEPFLFANATEAAQVPLRVTAQEETLLEQGSPSEGIGYLTVEGVSGVFTIEADTGETLDFSLIQAAEVTSAELAFTLGGASPQPISDGGVYEGTLDTADFIFALSAMTRAGTTPMCTAGRVDDFQMRAPSSSSCSVPAAGDQHTQKVYPEGVGGARVGVDLSVDQSGRCAFTVDAPAFNGGAGWSTALSVTIENAEDLGDTERE